MNGMNAVGWFEIYVQDMARARAFYETVLGVALSDLPNPGDEELKMMAFSMDEKAMEQPGSSGALVQMAGAPSGGNSTVVYFVSEDCAVEESRVESAGGSIFKPKMSIGPYGFVSLCNDTEGNMFGVHSMK